MFLISCFSVCSKLYSSSSIELSNLHYSGFNSSNRMSNLSFYSVFLRAYVYRLLRTDLSEVLRVVRSEIVLPFYLRKWSKLWSLKYNSVSYYYLVFLLSWGSWLILNLLFSCLSLSVNIVLIIESDVSIMSIIFCDSFILLTNAAFFSLRLLISLTMLISSPYSTSSLIIPKNLLIWWPLYVYILSVMSSYLCIYYSLWLM